MSKILQTIIGLTIISHFFGGCSPSKPIDFFTPYNYGYNVEIEVNNNGLARVKNSMKHYSFGKYTPEQGYVLPDNRTVYLTDDGSFRGLYLFIADRAKDLSKGTLYMARFQQDKTYKHEDPVSADGNGGRGSLEWIRLGHGASAQIEKIIRKNLLLSDFFDIADPKNCPENEGYRRITAGDPETMCLRLRDGENGSSISGKFKDKDEFLLAVAFLETRKYGVWLGATAEFRKGEGITFDGKNRLFISMSALDKSMEKNYHDEAQDKVTLTPNVCGVVYEFQLNQNQNDPSGQKIDSDYVATEMQGLVWGDYDPGTKTCRDFTISNPDNLRYLKGDKLIIGEDTSLHESNMVWVYDLKAEKYQPNVPSRSLTRILTLPVNSESTGTFETHFDKKTNNFYIFANAQHLFNKVDRPAPEDLNAIVGYLKIEGMPDDDFSNAVFENLELPADQNEKKIVRSTEQLTIGDKNYKVRYNVLYRSGDRDESGHVVGALVDNRGEFLRFPDGSLRISQQPDAQSLFVRGDGYVLISHFEDSPGILYSTTVKIDEKGDLKPVRFQPIDYSDVGGTFINCAGNHTPWDTHLSSEEDYYLDAYHFDPASRDFIDQHISYCEKDDRGKLTGRYLKNDAKEDFTFWCHLVKGIANDYLHDRF